MSETEALKGIKTTKTKPFKVSESAAVSLFIIRINLHTLLDAFWRVPTFLHDQHFFYFPVNRPINIKINDDQIDQSPGTHLMDKIYTDTPFQPDCYDGILVVKDKKKKSIF